MTWPLLLVLLLAAALAAGGAVALGLRWRRRRGPRRALQLLPAKVERAPSVRIVRRPSVVLVHGFMGFDELRLPGARIDYFRGVPRHLQRLGVDVRVARVPPARRIRTRARALAPQLGRRTDPQVIVIAHSMGGLDARYAIARLGAAARVAELVTVATPHHGTPLADLSSAILQKTFGLGGLLEAIGVEPAAFRDLTTAHMRKFNATTADAPGVRYASVVAGTSFTLHPLLLPGLAYLRACAGDSDGMVPTASQRWGDVLAEVEADHLAIIGWSGRFDAVELYIDILRRLGLSLPQATRKPRRLATG